MRRPSLMPAAKAQQRKLRKAMQALRLANDVMSYCQGDAWERECTKDAREKFDKLYTQLMEKKS
jgi:thiamine pyrophosphate-dependent acetolactate synthase large subunit-like protein